MSRAAGDELSSSADRRGDAPAASPAARLGERLDRLPPGHPSSPYEADGTRRQPAVRLRDYDTYAADDQARESEVGETELGAGADDGRPAADGARPFTDAEWADHCDEVDNTLTESRSAELASDYLYTNDPDRRSWTEDRSNRHREIINEIYARAADVPNQYQAVLAGGLTGAGKTTVLKEVADIDRSNYLTINPDDIKEELAKRGLIPEIDGLSPMEASDLVHEESSYVALQLAVRAQADGKNLIWDITMSSHAKVEERINNLQAAGYEKVDGIFVDIPVDVSVRRADARHREGEEDYRCGKGLGGRYVPQDVIFSQSDEAWGSRNRRTFEELKTRFNQWSLYDNSVDGRRAILLEKGSRDDTPEERTP
jgi:predicted kinase